MLFLSFTGFFFSILLFVFIIYFFITATYCQLFSKYQLINIYLFICSFITLAYSNIFTLTYNFSLDYNIFSLPYNFNISSLLIQLCFSSVYFFSCDYHCFEHISEVLTFSIDITHFDKELSFDCFLFSCP